jgi:hypothetical protein
MGDKRAAVLLAGRGLQPWSAPMNIRVVLWTVCMGFSGFLLARGTPSITGMAILGLCIGAGVGVALGIMFTHRAERKHAAKRERQQPAKPGPQGLAA